MSEAADLEFECPSCRESLDVNDSMRDALIANGCVICGAAVTKTAFSVPTAPSASGTTSTHAADASPQPGDEVARDERSTSTEESDSQPSDGESES
ncbi:MAG: hypothetical protein A07HR60_01654 [uncultured archaeon A07HR60]|nr:MAG: hypothetical protein A07HR60_01654 [uncultured archaeon A07HR60]